MNESVLAIYDGPACNHCGGGMDSVDCWQCGGEGLSHHDCGEDSCCCLDDSPNVVCDICVGEGRFWVCGNSEEWCAAHPLPKEPQP